MLPPERTLIIDVPGAGFSRGQFEALGFSVIDAAVLTEHLVAWNGWRAIDPQMTLLILPGNGASIVRRYLPRHWFREWQSRSVHAKRHWTPGSDPVVEVGVAFPDRMILGLRDIIIVDDVISSGQTCRKIRQANEPWFPGAHWGAVCWVRQRAAALRGFTQSYGVVETGTEFVRAPINSLSTFLDDSGIAQSYAKRHYEDPRQFLEALQYLRDCRGPGGVVPPSLFYPLPFI